MQKPICLPFFASSVFYREDHFSFKIPLNSVMSASQSPLSPVYHTVLVQEQVNSEDWIDQIDEGHSKEND